MKGEDDIYSRKFGILTTPQSHTRNLTAWLSWVSVSLLMWNVVEPFEVGSLADLVVVLEVAQSQNHQCLYLAEEEDSEAQTAVVIVADSVVVEEGGIVDEVEDSVEVEAASVVDVMTMGVVVVAAAGTVVVVVDSGVYCTPHCPTCG